MSAFLTIPGTHLPFQMSKVSAWPNVLDLQSAMPFSCAFLSLVLCCRASTGSCLFRVHLSSARTKRWRIQSIDGPPLRYPSLLRHRVGANPCARRHWVFCFGYATLRVSVPPQNFAGSAFANFSGPAKKADLRHLGAGPLAQLCYVCPEHIREIKTEKTPCIRTESRSSVF